MPKLIDNPTVIEAAGNKPKRIEEFVGRVNTESSEISVTKMTSPEGWVEPGQTIITDANEWVRYSTPTEEGAEYIAICLPAFSPDSVNRDI